MKTEGVFLGVGSGPEFAGMSSPYAVASAVPINSTLADVVVQQYDGPAEAAGRLPYWAS